MLPCAVHKLLCQKLPHCGTQIHGVSKVYDLGEIKKNSKNDIHIFHVYIDFHGILGHEYLPVLVKCV